jgi:hypothetical protein
MLLLFDIYISKIKLHCFISSILVLDLSFDLQLTSNNEQEILLFFFISKKFIFNNRLGSGQLLDKKLMSDTLQNTRITLNGHLYCHNFENANAEHNLHSSIAKCIGLPPFLTFCPI